MAKSATEPLVRAGRQSRSNSGIKSRGDDLNALDAYLTKPKDIIDKTKVAMAGIKDADDRANLIAYLASVATD